MSDSNTVVGEKPLVKKWFSTNPNFSHHFFAKNSFGAAMSKADGGMMPFTSLEEVWHKRQLTGREQIH
jgi:hypothetical protein